LVRAGRDLLCDTVKLRLQFRGKVYFHVPRVGKTGTGVKHASVRIKTYARLPRQVWVEPYDRGRDHVVPMRGQAAPGRGGSVATAAAVRALQERAPLRPSTFRGLLNGTHVRQVLQPARS
jgi:hypothetical protein